MTPGRFWKIRKEFRKFFNPPLKKDGKVLILRVFVNLVSSALSKILISLPFLVLPKQDGEILDKIALSSLLKV